MKKLWIRLRTCYEILFLKKRHWVFINVDRENLIKMLKEEEFTVSMNYHGLQPYNIFCIVKMIAEKKDDIDMICDKAEFEADAIVKAKIDH